MRPPPPGRGEFRHFLEILTRWGDNDAFGHASNVVYYSWYETALARWLHGVGAVDVHDSPLVGVMVENGCRFHAPVRYPERVTVGLRAEQVGRSSVRYGVAVFRDDDAVASASGHLVHVYVDRATQRSPQPLPEAFRRHLDDIAAPVAAPIAAPIVAPAAAPG